MNTSCNKAANAVNSGAGHIIFHAVGAGLATAATLGAAAYALPFVAPILAGGLVNLGTLVAKK